MSNAIADAGAICPTCHVVGQMEFKITANRFVREYKDADGKLQRLHYGRSADYHCKNCGLEFIVTNMGERPALPADTKAG